MPITATYPDWSILENLPLGEVEPLLDEKLEDDTYAKIITYDALNRSLATVNGGGVQYMVYNDAGFLEKVEAEVAGHDGRDTIVKNIDYDAKGQQTRIQYGNGVTTRYEYDEKTFRLIRLLSTRNNGTDILQNISYRYDPVGNITRIYDQSQAVIFHNGEEVKPENIYSYDALYQLIEASGRESRRIAGKPPTNKETIPVPHSINPSNAEVRNYRQYYSYDTAGNILSMQHVANGGSWTRKYDYSNPETGEEKNNWLHSTSLGDNEIYPDKYHYDAHGNMTKMPHLNSSAWDYKDQLIYVDIDPECADDQEEEKEPQKREVFYTYNSGRQRVKKVYHMGRQIKERIYLGSYEIYRVNGQKKLETFHVMDDSQRVCMVETTDEGQQYFRYQVSNHLDSASMELDENAVTITYEEYHPYGTTSYRAKNIDMAGVPQKRYRYTGMERDEETGLNYHTARYYLPWLGRWVNPDISGMIDGHNLIRFSRNNGINFTDTNGENSLVEKAKNYTDDLIERTENYIETSKKELGEEAKKYINLVVLTIIVSEKPDENQSPSLRTQFSLRGAMKMVELFFSEEIEEKGYDLAIEFIKHYVSGEGEKLVFDVPDEWKKEIAKRYRKPGSYKDVDPYEWGLGDMRNTLGHFDLDVSSEQGSEKLKYEITDVYSFPYEKYKKGSKKLRHGFQLPKNIESIDMLKALLPAGDWLNPGGFKEKFEIITSKKTKETTLYVPQQFLVRIGQKFKVQASFESNPKNRRKK